MSRQEIAECQHCGRLRTIAARGLCRACYDQRPIRVLYPYSTLSTSYELHDDTDPDEPSPITPADTLPCMICARPQKTDPEIIAARKRLGCEWVTCADCEAMSVAVSYQRVRRVKLPNAPKVKKYNGKPRGKSQNPWIGRSAEK